MISEIGGFACGFLAGASARNGRLCTMSAIEDAVVASDRRALKAWGLAVAIAIAGAQLLVALGHVELGQSGYATPQLDWVASVVGGILFGFGMALVGTCSFGLIVRLGGGDLRAAVSSAVIGIAAFAFTAGALQPLRTSMSGHFAIDIAGGGGATLPGLLQGWLGNDAIWGVVAAGVVLLALPALLDAKVRRRRRLLAAALGLGVAVSVGWGVTAAAVDQLEGARLESLSFVAPVGRLLLAIMGEPMQFAGFGVATVVGVAVGAFAVAAWKDEVRWEAYDDAREMRRHLVGAVLMGLGGVLARGCTIGQGMSAASLLALSAPLTIIGVVFGAKLGLVLLLEGRAHWRLGTDR